MIDGPEVTAVLYSGGLDSAVLVASEARRLAVQPMYVSVGLAWEAEEVALAERLLKTPAFGAVVRPLQRLSVTVTDVFPEMHWAIRGAPPAYDTPDEDVYLPGRNLLLLAKAAVACAAGGIHRIAIGPLAGNPFPDATPAFFASMAASASLALAHDLTIAAPFGAMHKADVIRLGSELGVPFALTMSCMNPRSGLHCGVCSKCRERRDGFEEAGIHDPTSYAAPSPRLRTSGA
jgi:7-cyano-7-deazaguanine synthase